MTYQDKALTCKECGTGFAFTAAEQAFYAEKGFRNEPARCPECRSARKQATGRGPAARPQRELFAAVCSACGVTTQVPFKPTAGKPVYCRDCFQVNKKY
ncbi:zinc-ribbon domain containing protein [Sporolituus thermophilus]|uniref:CxxC-x17-CxxC domain-containing protein n=1 Tax=Sporolituus thermophilus DSM 23256 TaxID=1123285 RepID=A0A1G7KJ73_9FIRM|nr:zinc-ribbon domain containing protein [Sporolituus thermophilus]SDF37242.1 CxxC-x17-CxxC domain-containing protein [Sporolituus thermophilus DSM 23256]